MLQFLGWQILGLLIVITWTAVTSGIVFGILRLFGVLRVSEELERKGNTSRRLNQRCALSEW